MKNSSTLEWFLEAGVTDIVGDEPVNFITRSAKDRVAKPAPAALSEVRQNISAQEEMSAYQAEPAPRKPAPVSASLAATIAEARELADNAKTLDDLRRAVENFNGCNLKKTASKTVFADGNPTSKVMLIGEAPGADEDREGLPFVGVSGQLLDKVLFSIGLTRKDSFYITNTLFWRPPGNRKPTPEELAVCEPFLEKHIALVNPKILLLVGATAVQGILHDQSSMAKLRGNVYHYKNRYMQHDVPVMVTYHPSFLLRAPLNKRLAWEDMLALQEQIKIIG